MNNMGNEIPNKNDEILDSQIHGAKVSGSKNKIIALLLTIIAVIALIIGFTINSTLSDDASKTQMKQSKSFAKEKNKKPEEDFGIKVKDPSKALKDISDDRTLDFIAKLAQFDDKHVTSYGDPNAPLTIVEFSDYSCPMCAKFHKDSFSDINKLVDAGKVRVKYMPYTIFKTYGSDIASAGAIAAGKQGKFRQYSQLLFDKATTSGHQQYTKESVIDFGKKAGVPNMDEFVKTINDSSVYDDLNKKVLEYSSWGISGTPATIVGKTIINGALPKEYVNATLVDQLKKALK